MKSYVLAMLLSLVVAFTSGLVFADTTYTMKGSGAAVTDSENSTLYSSIMRISFLDSSTIDKGAILVRGSNSFMVVRFTGDQWKVLYDKDGSFHAEGLGQTINHDSYSISLDGTRVFATQSGSMWKVIANMQDNAKKFVMNFLLLGKDPNPAVNVSNEAQILIPNGNSAQANTGFFLPLNLEVIRGTIVTWQNQDDIRHTIQSQDSHGNIISLFNSGLLKTGDTFSYKFDKPGAFHYFCTIHPWRIGIVTVS